MEALYVCADPGVPVFGSKGASIHVREVVRALGRRGVTTSLAAVRLGGEVPSDLAGVDVTELPRPSSADPATRERQALATNPALAATVAGRDGLGLVYERYSLWSYGALEEAAARGIPTVLEVNAPLLEEQSRHRVLVDRAGAAHATARAFAAADAIVAVSDEVARWASSVVGSTQRVHVVPNGVDPRRFRPLPRPHGRPFTVAFVGSLKPWHGVGTVLEALPALGGRRGDAEFLLIGDGPERERLAVRAVELGIAGAVHATGAVEQDAVPTLLAQADVAVVPYLETSETYFSPLKLFEYLACGLPVVASDIGQVREIITHGVTGLLHPPGDVAAMVGALWRLRDDPLLRSALGGAGRELVLRRHTWDHVAARILDLVRTSSVVP